MSVDLKRRDLLKGAGALLATRGFGWEAPASPPPHHVVLINLRGGYDAVLSVNPQDTSQVGESVHCGYRPDERIRGAQRLFGPLIGGLERHDAALCLVHGVRSDTTNHPDGLAMLERGSVRARNGRFADELARHLPGTAPLAVLDLASLDGGVMYREAERPAWAELRTELHRGQLEALRAGAETRHLLAGALSEAYHLERFLDEARAGAGALPPRFSGDLGQHFRLAFQAIRGGWARVVEIGARNLWFDSHSDNDRFQRTRQPSFFADLAAFLDLLGAERNAHGRLIEQTTIAVFSEFGRFPRLNGERGKDHWPENSWILAGKGVRSGATIGATDAVGKGLVVDYRSGEPRPGGRPLFIDNAFATLVRIAKGDLRDTGYSADAAIDAIVSS